MVKLGIISNPRSQRNKRGLAAVDAVIKGRPDIDHRRLRNFEDLPAAVADFQNAGVEVIVVNGGDGTVQATLTELFNSAATGPAPALAILSSGMTNMIAADAGVRGSPTRGLKRLISKADRGELSTNMVTRNVIRMDFGADGGPVCGMFFGAAGIYRGIQLCREKVHALGFQSSLAVGLTLFGVVVGWLLPWRGNDGVFQGDQIGANLDDAETLDKSYFLMVVSTLDRLALGIRPFWGRPKGALKFMGVTFPPRHFTRSLPRLLYGGRERTLPADTYLNRSADVIKLDLNSPFTLDGELYHPVPGVKVELSDAGQVRFVKL